MLGRPPVLLGLLTTVLGFAGVFAVFTYIAADADPRSPASREAAVSPILLVFGGGLIVGNLLGGRLADRRLVPAVLGTLVALALVLGCHDLRPPQPGRGGDLRRPARRGRLRHRGAAADVGAGEGRRAPARASPPSFNIAAFNLGNAIGAWLGGVVIDHGAGLAAVIPVAALIPLAALAMVILAQRVERNGTRRAAAAACAEAAE